MADAVEQALLLLEDMAELQSMKRHEIFLSLKRYLAMVCLLLDLFFLFLLHSFNCFPHFPFLNSVSFFGRLFKPPSGQRR